MCRLVIPALLVCLGSSAWADAQTPPPRPAPRRPAAPAPPKPAAPRPAPVVEAPPAPPSDVKVVTAYTQGAQVSQNTTYVRGPRQRVEFPGLVSLDQCDLKRSVVLSPATKRYRAKSYDAPASAPVTAPDSLQDASMPERPVKPVPGGVVSVTTTLTDTGERQPMFGLEARRIRTVVTRVPSKDACEKVAVRTEIDAWYVDLPASASCTRPTASKIDAPADEPPACQDRTESRVEGQVTLGFPVKTTTTVTTGDGPQQESSSTVAEVTALEITRLDASLFEVPADFTEAGSVAELTPAVAAGGTLADALFGSTADGTSAAAPKLAGKVRIGILEPVNKSARASVQMSALRQELVTRLTKGSFEALPLKGSTVDGVVGDLARLECDYVLLTDVVEVKTSKPGKVGGMMRMVSGGAPGRDNHEVKMAYRLYPADRTATARFSGDVKADNGGGFGLRTALHIAAFAGQMSMGLGAIRMMRGFGDMGGLGMGMGMLNPMYGLASTGGMGTMAGSFYDPRSMAMSAMAQGLAGAAMSAGGAGMPTLDSSDQEVFQVAADATGDVAKHVIEKLKTGK